MKQSKSHNKQRACFSVQSGFSLIELLVVISVIGILAGLLLPNFVGMRSRANDTQLKSDLKTMQTALRLYYNDHQQYPGGSGGEMLGCGASGTASCTPGGLFDGPDNTVYMGKLPQSFAYYSDNGDEFVAIATLQNASDADIAASQTRCAPQSRAYVTATIGELDYVTCER